jgi:hypothetical protein
VVLSLFQKNGGGPRISSGTESFDISSEIDCVIPRWKLGPRSAVCAAAAYNRAALKLCCRACWACASSHSWKESLSARLETFQRKLSTFHSPRSGTSHTTKANVLLIASADSSTCACSGTLSAARDSQPSGFDKSVAQTTRPGDLPSNSMR